MIEEIKKETGLRMGKSIEALNSAFSRIRTGRAHPNLLDGIHVSYYGSDMPLNQVANVNVEDARTLMVTPWEKSMVQEIEKAIMKADLGLNPATAGTVIRIPMPALTEETRKHYTKQAKQEAESARISVRNVRRDSLSQLKDLLKEKEISEDDEKINEKLVQTFTDEHIKTIDSKVEVKEKEIMTI